ncbi:MAG TPA: hypothetical protein VGX48_21530 [Pyrinomonadaceae bacterium]|jgi:hypothetical protein|nr:hypothetical protein [Pyrinomonadaceae bacterium]
MTNSKCLQCGLVNFTGMGECKRCGGALPEASYGVAWVEEEEEERPARRSVLRKVLAGIGLSAFLLVVWYVSLLETSRAADYDQRQQVGRAVGLVNQAGLGRDAFLLGRLANYRTDDNWWNAWLGHGEAYAAANFPFEVVTLYPDFFLHPTDDTERAVILLHEAKHLAGADEEEALRAVWRDKWRLGWTREKYGHTRVWRNVSELTRRHAPALFQCSPDKQQDCEE